MDAPPPNINAAPADFNPNVPPPLNKCPMNYSYQSPAYPQYGFPPYFQYGYNHPNPYSQAPLPYSPHLPPPSPSHNHPPFPTHGAQTSTPRGPPPITTHSLPCLPHGPPPSQPPFRPPPMYTATSDSTICSNSSVNYYSYSCPPPPGSYTTLPPPPINTCPPPTPPPPPRYRPQTPFRAEKPAAVASSRNTALIQIELKKTPRSGACLSRQQNSCQNEQENIRRTSSLPNLSQKSLRPDRNNISPSTSSISHSRQRSLENERPYRPRLQTKDESERDRLLKTWRSQYCETSEEIARKLAELANNVEKEVWVRSSPAELYYTRTNNGSEVESTIRSDTLCQVFEEELVKRSEKIKNIQAPYNPPPRARKKRLCRHKCKYNEFNFMIILILIVHVMLSYAFGHLYVIFL